MTGATVGLGSRGDERRGRVRGKGRKAGTSLWRLWVCVAESCLGSGGIWVWGGGQLTKLAAAFFWVEWYSEKACLVLPAHGSAADNDDDDDDAHGQPLSTVGPDVEG